MDRSRVTAMAALSIGALLTGFYFVHEALPRAIRAPTSLLLTPIAVVDGLCYALGLTGIYGRPLPVFLVNLAAGLVLCSGLHFVRRWWQGRPRPFSSSDELFAAVDDLVGRLDVEGQAEAAAELRQGLASVNGLTDGYVLFLDSIERVRTTYASRLARAEQLALGRIRAAVRAVAFRR